MLRMILADDEPVITKGIQKLVDWNSLGIEVVGEYEDGKAALDGILINKPDIALLDISMPKKTGIDILKEIKNLGLSTMVIFISGFQDFQYAKDALSYGAVDYLLKPVIREELVRTVEKCISSLRPEFVGEEELTQGETRKGDRKAAYDKLVEVEVEECCYRPVLTEILYSRPMNRQEKKLVQFSVISYLEQYLEDRNLGIVFVKNGHIVMVLKNVSEEEAGGCVSMLMEQAASNLNCRLGFVIGRPVDSMGEIPGGYQECLSMSRYFYFADQLKTALLHCGGTVYRHQETLESVDENRRMMIDAMIAQDEEAFGDWAGRLRRSICVLADGRKDDACFHYGSTLRIIEGRLEAIGVAGIDTDFKQILEQARESENFCCLTGLFETYFRQYMEQIRKTVMNGDKKDITLAREYIEAHYRDNLTLEVLSGIIHMNPYYFSSFFKKNSGENFKDYLNKVRMTHAVSLLVSSDKKTAEIAELAGFRDARAFSELFQRFYGETPSNYRKRVKER